MIYLFEHLSKLLFDQNILLQREIGIFFFYTRPANDIYSQICLSKIVGRIFPSNSHHRQPEREEEIRNS